MDDSNQIIVPFYQSLFCLEDITCNISELGIDTIFEEGLIRDIPIVNAVFSLCKFGYNVHERNMLKQTLIFLQEFNAGYIEKDKLEKYKTKLNSNKNYAEKELGRVIIILNKTVESEKTKILARLFRNYINNKLSWETFCSMSETLDVLIIMDIPIIKQLDNNPGITERAINNISSLKRLIALGIIYDYQNQPPWQISKEYADRTSFALTDYGKIFFEFGIL